MNVTEASEQVLGLLPLMFIITMIVGGIAGFLDFRRKKDRKGTEENQLGLDPLDMQIQEIYKTQKRYRKG